MSSKRSYVTDEQLEEVRSAVESCSKAFVKSRDLKPLTESELDSSIIGHALRALEDEGALELYRENSGPNVFRVRGVNANGYSKDMGGKRPIVPDNSPLLDDVREAVLECGKSYVKAKSIADAVDASNNLIGHALKKLDDEGDTVELYNDRVGNGNVYRVRGDE